MTTDVPILDVLAAIQAALVRVAPSKTGKQALNEWAAPVRYVWVLTGVDPKASTGIGGNPRSLADDSWDVEVYAFAPTLREAIRLRQAVVTATRQTITANYGIGRSELVTDDEICRNGHCVATLLRITTPLPEADLSGQVTDATLQVVAPLTTSNDNTTSAPGDGRIDAGES